SWSWSCVPRGRSRRIRREFKVLQWRWSGERTFAWWGRYRRLSKDYEGTEESSESWIYIAMTHLMLRRLEPA
ncbi:MAG TPA: transposase, partial [Isosphaeraceae bacterium]|nr:transposase [Isosphaeraceae bacterium]